MPSPKLTAQGNLPAESKYGDRRHKTDRITRHLDNAIFDKDWGKALLPAATSLSNAVPGKTS
ncbi:hypothetical protein ACLK2I_12690 [Escherichia coli]